MKKSKIEIELEEKLAKLEAVYEEKVNEMNNAANEYQALKTAVDKLDFEVKETRRQLDANQMMILVNTKKGSTYVPKKTYDFVNNVLKSMYEIHTIALSDFDLTWSFDNDCLYAVIDDHQNNPVKFEFSKEEGFY